MPAAPLRSILLALALTTCERTPVTETPAEPEVATAPTPVERPSTPAADPTHPLELVPARARAMLMVSSPQRLAQAWARERFIGRSPEQYERVVDEVKRELGFDPLDPGALAGVGVDPTAPVGIAVLSFHDEALAIFGATTDRQLMVDLLQRVSKEPLSRQTVGEAELVRLNEELTVVFRHGMFAIVFVDRVRPGSPDYAKEVARIDPAQSLAHSPAMERAYAGLPHQADAKALLDVSGILRDELERVRRRDQEEVGEASRRLAEARQRGASAEELNSLQQDIQRSQEFAASRRREQQVGELLLSRTLGAIEGIGLAVDASDRGLRGSIHIGLAPDATFRELFVSSEQPPPAIAALGDAPQLVISAQVDVGIAIDLLAQAMLASGTTYARVNDEVRDALRIDFDRALRPVLDGRGTFVLTSSPPVDPKRGGKLEDTMGGILALGVNDDAKARAVLEEVLGRWPELAFAPVPEIDGWSLTRAEWPKTLYMGLVAGQLVMGSDLATLRRLRDGQAGPASTHLPDPEPWQRMTQGPGAGRLAMHHRLPVMLVFSFLRGFDSFDFPQNPDDVISSEHPDHDVFSIPRSAATQRLEKDRDRAFEAKQQAQHLDTEARQIAGWNRADALGITGGVVRQVDTGLMLEGGHYVRGGLGGYVEALVALADRGSDDSSYASPELLRARKRYEEVNARLVKARRKEVERHIAKSKP